MTSARDIIETKLRGALEQLRFLPRTLGLIWTASRPWTTAWLVLLVLQGALPALTVYLTRGLVDNLVAVTRNHTSIERTLWLVGALSGLVLLSELLRTAANWVRTAQTELIQDHLSDLIQEKSAAVDLEFYESPEYYDHLHRARAEAAYRPVALLESLGSMLQNGITLGAMLIVLLQFGVWVPLALVASTLPALYIVLGHSLQQYHWRRRSTPLERRAWYYDGLLTTGSAAAELRLFDLGSFFRNEYRALRGQLRSERLKLVRRQALGELAAGFLGLSIASGFVIWIVIRAARGEISLGNVALFYLAFQQGLRLMRTLLENVGQLYNNTLFLSDLFAFLALQPRIGAPARPASLERPRREIRFENVTFRYPGSSRVALRDFHLTIPAGSFVAIVGPNGAGKSTLLKLLCRFYDPEGGRVEIDGSDIRDLAPAALRSMITVLFQEPVHYTDSVADNIAVGSRSSGNDAQDVRRAAQAAGAHELIEGLPQGYETLLGKWFTGGVELSVGEWQRIALARAFLRQSPILILDEPTSAMDPWAESDWLDRFRALSKGRTAIIITHRFTTAMHADIIHVIANGGIEESGSHSELLARGGRYAQSWAAQMQEAHS